MTGPLCDAVTEADDGGDTLEALERANLFVIALDDRRRWYRYHHLFADVLRARSAGGAAGPDPDPPPAGERLVRAGGRSRGSDRPRARGRRHLPGR